MNIANGTTAAISLQSLTKSTDGKGKGGAFLGKVIAKSGKEIQVLINDKIYKIQPENAQNIKIGDKIQVFFGKSLPHEISEEILKRISGKLIDVFSLSLPYKTTQELEDLINNLPQNERLQFAKISNVLVQMTKSILQEEYSLHTIKDSGDSKVSFDLFNSNLPYNRRLIELSLKVKEMGKTWEQLPDDIKKEIIKKYVLFDLQKQKSENEVQKDENKQTLTRKEVNSSIKKEATLIQEKLPNIDKEKITKNKNVVQDKFFGKPNHTNIKNQTEKTLSIFNLHNKEEQTKKETSHNPEEPDVKKTKETNEVFFKKNIETNKEVLNPLLNENQKALKEKVINELLSKVGTKSNAYNSQKEEVDINNKTNSGKVSLQTDETVNNQKTLSTNKATIHSTSNTFREKSNIFTNDEIKTIVTVLRNSISKPLAIEENLENLTKTLKNRKNVNDQKNTANILQLIKTLSTKESPNSILTKDNVNQFTQTTENFAKLFKKVTNAPLINIETKNFMTLLNRYGIDRTEAHQTTQDIINLATRTNTEMDINQQLYSIALKKYLKLKLPQLILNNNIMQNDENSLIKKIETFSKRVFMIIKTYTESLPINKESSLFPTEEKANIHENNANQSTNLKKALSDENNTNFNKKSFSHNDSDKFSSPVDKGLKTVGKKEQTTEQKTITKDNEINTKQLNHKKETNQIQSNIRIEKEKPTSIDVKTQTKIGENIEKNEIHSEKLLKFLNITSEKNDYSNPYSSLLTLNEQPFVIDFHHNKTDKGGYEKNDMYRVFIETNTQLFGTVFIDTVVSNKKIDIYIYSEERYAKAFTNNSSLLIKRIKETDYDLRGLYIREKLDQNGILKLKVKQYSNSKEVGGFYGLA